MTFLQEKDLTSAIKKLIKQRGPIRLAVAYWGKESLKLLDIDPKRKDISVICCLRGGKSDPDVIRRFGERARQHDRLHAKVIWTRSGAIVSSANASSNGLPEEEEEAAGLIEAGYYTDDQSDLVSIERWLDKLSSTSCVILKRHLDAARAARQKRAWGQRGARTKQRFVDAVKEGRLEFDKQRIFFVFWKDAATMAQQKAAKTSVAENKRNITERFKMSDAEWGTLDYYFNWPNLPADSFLIDVSWSGGRWDGFSVWKTFGSRRTWPVRNSQGGDRLTFVTNGARSFPYAISSLDKKLLQASAENLWRAAKGNARSRVISILEAGPIISGA